MTSAPDRGVGSGRDLQYLAYAEAYTEAARHLAESASVIDAVRIPFFHLAGHALELMLKAVLSHQGRDEERLMMMGHSLDRCYANAVSGGAHRLDDTKIAAFVEALNQPHSFQAFRYPQPFDRTPPEPAEAMRLLSKQLGVVRTYLSSGE